MTESINIKRDIETPINSLKSENESQNHNAERPKYEELIAEQEYNKIGSVYFCDTTGNSKSGDIYEVDDIRYILDESDLLFDYNDKENIEDPIVKAIIAAQINEDKSILSARNTKAEKLAEECNTIPKVLELHFEFTDGLLEESIKRNGINFYKVGRNSTCYFYAGVDENKKMFSLSICPFEEGEEDASDISEIKKDSYIGHS